MPTQPLRFRLRCVPHGPYYTVRIFPTKSAMQRWAAHANPSNLSGYLDTEGAVFAYTKHRYLRRKWRRTPDLGWIVLYRGHLGAGIVSHELTHAALYYLQFWRPQLFHRLQTSRKADETLAWVQGFLTAKFWEKFYQAVGPVRGTGSYRRVRGV